MKMNKKTILLGSLSVLAIAALFYFGEVNQIAQMAKGSMTHADSTDLSSQLFTASKTEKTTKTGAFGEYVNIQKKGGEAEEVPDYIRRPKDLERDFSGYKVELTTVFNKKLSLNDAIYKEFGGITIDQRTATSYTYLVGDFSDKDACEEYLDKVIKNRYPEAIGVKYENGALAKYK